MTKQSHTEHSHPNDNSMSHSKFELAETPKANIEALDMFSGFKQDYPAQGNQNPLI